MRLLGFALVVVLGFSLGCGLLQRADAPHFTEEAALTAPWTELALPSQTGKVTFSDAETVEIHHPRSEPVAELGARYGGALEAAGFTRDRDDSTELTVNQTWTRDDDVVSLAVLEQAGDHVVSIAFVPF